MFVGLLIPDANGSRPTLTLLRGDIILEQSSYLIWLLWEAGGSGCGAQPADAASLITIDITPQKKKEKQQKRGTGRWGWQQRGGEDPCSLFN